MVTAIFLGDACRRSLSAGARTASAGRGYTPFAPCHVPSQPLALPLGLMANAARWPCLLLMGGTAGALYTLAIVRLGDRFSGNALISANAFVGLLWGAGSLGGHCSAASRWEKPAPHGLMLFVAAGATLALLSMLSPRAPDGRKWWPPETMISPGISPCRSAWQS